MAALIRWSPNGGMAVRPYFRPFGLLEEVEEMARATFAGELTPRMDMSEDDKEIVIRAEMPGVSKADLNITLEDDVLTIKAEKKEEKEEGEEGKAGTAHYVRERHFGRYVRCMSLPALIDAEKVTATLKKGLLEIKLPKTEAPEARQIEIKVK
jgi:HSP20 family protein